MTVIHTDRKKLDVALGEDGATLLLISDDPDPVAELVHEKAEAVAKDWHRVLLITDLAVLKPKERQQWFSEEGHYVVVGGRHTVVAVRGPISDLMLPSGKPSGVEIRWALNQGDLLP
jgi:hypothetical protein